MAFGSPDEITRQSVRASPAARRLDLSLWMGNQIVKVSLMS